MLKSLEHWLAAFVEEISDWLALKFIILNAYKSLKLTKRKSQRMKESQHRFSLKSNFKW
jgi:hypothetical protein